MQLIVIFEHDLNINRHVATDFFFHWMETVGKWPSWCAFIFGLVGSYNVRLVVIKDRRPLVLFSSTYLVAARINNHIKNTLINCSFIFCTTTRMLKHHCKTRGCSRKLLPLRYVYSPHCFMPIYNDFHSCVLVSNVNCIDVVFRMPKSKEVLSSTSGSDSDSEVDTKVWKLTLPTQHYSLNKVRKTTSHPSLFASTSFGHLLRTTTCFLLSEQKMFYTKPLKILINLKQIEKSCYN